MAPIRSLAHYLWRVADQEGEARKSYVTKTCDKRAALAFMKKALKPQGSPQPITIGGLRSCMASRSAARAEWRKLMA